jgi:hypothetical protein
MASHRDMVIPFVADLNMIREQQQQLIVSHLIACNRERISYDTQ